MESNNGGMTNNLSSGGDKHLNHSPDGTPCNGESGTGNRAAVRKPAPAFKGMAYWDKKF